MTVADSVRRAVSIARKVPAQLGLHPHVVKLQVTTYAGGNTGRGAATVRELSILEGGTNPRVAWLTHKQLSAGGWNDGTIEVGPLTPEYDSSTGAGWSFDELAATGVLAVQGTLHLHVVGPRVPTGQKYSVRDIKRTNFRWVLTAVPVT